MGWGPSAPDMTASNAATAAGVKMNQEQWDYYKDNIAPRAQQQMDDQIQIARDSYGMAKEGQNFQMGLAKQYNDRYWNQQAPLQDQMLRDAQNFNTEGRREELAGQANADVTLAGMQAQDQNRRGLARMGINPSSGAALALGNQTSMMQAAASSNAMNKVRQAARAEGYGRLTDANAMMAGLSGFSNSASNNANSWVGTGVTAGASGMAGISSASGMSNSAANGASLGMYSGSQNYRSNAIESAKDPTFDFFAGLATGGVKAAGQANGISKLFS